MQNNLLRIPVFTTRSRFRSQLKLPAACCRELQCKLRRFPVAGQLIAFVMVEMARLVHRLLEAQPRPVQPYLDRIERRSENNADLGIRESFQVGKHKNSPVMFRQIVHETANAVGHILSDQEGIVQRSVVHNGIFIIFFVLCGTRRLSR